MRLMFKYFRALFQRFYVDRRAPMIDTSRQVLDDASKALAQGNHLHALELYRLYCDKVPSDLSGHIGRGLCLLMLARPQECAQEMESVRSSFPEHDAILGIAVRAYAALSDWHRMFEVWKHWSRVLGDKGDAAFFAYTAEIWGELLRSAPTFLGADVMLGRLLRQSDAAVAANATPALCAFVFRCHEYDRSFFLGIMCRIRAYRDLHRFDFTCCKAAATLALTFALVDDEQRRPMLASGLGSFDLYSHWSFILLGSASNAIWDPALLQTVKNVELVSSLLAELICDLGSLSAHTLYRLIVLANVCNHSAHDALLLEASRRLAVNAELGGVRADLACMVESRARLNVGKPPSGPRRKLKIAVCISGQLRGFRQSFQSWRHLGFDGHDVTFFVHTWRNTGGGIPVPPKDERCLPPRFQKVYRAAWEHRGAAAMSAAYPSFFALWDEDHDQVDAADIRSFYGTEHVRVDDDQSAPFCQFGNAEKMYYKIAKCHELMSATEIPFDIVVRLRPDMLFFEQAEIDWQQVHERSVGENVIFCEHYSTYLFPDIGYCMPDQFAIGAPAAMACYSGAHAMTLANRESHLLTQFPSEFLAHSNVAYATLYGTVKVEPVSLACTLVSTYRPAPVELAEAVGRDAAGRMDDVDRRLLDALAPASESPIS